jgi:hypothetical protein
MSGLISNNFSSKLVDIKEYPKSGPVFSVDAENGITYSLPKFSITKFNLL